MSIIISYIFEKGKYPNKLNIFCVVPVFSRTEVSNYRLIRTLLSINKIFEKLTYNRINEFVNKYSLICDNQYGYTDVIFEVSKFASDGLNNGVFLVCSFLNEI